MPLPREPARLGYDGRHSLEAFISELLDLPTLRAYQVLVVRHVARGLEPAEPFAEVALHQEPAFHQGVDRAVHGRRPDLPAARTDFLRDFLRREVPLGREQHLGNRQALRGHRKIVLAQVGNEALDYGVLGHRFWASAIQPRTVSPATRSVS